MKRCLVVLGMHRSGTSAFTGVLDLLGVNLGTRMLETQPDNPKGFFENKYVVQANDCILDTLGTAWDDTLPLPDNWTDRFDDTQLRVDIRAFLCQDMAADRLSALKDPRLCRLLPLWLPLFADEGVEPSFTLLIRHPLEIAESLASRNGFSREKSLLLWLQYTLEAERHTRGLPRAFVLFDQLLDDPRAAVGHAFRGAGLDIPAFDPSREVALAEFVDRNMRHHRLDGEQLAGAGVPLVAELYQLLCRIAGNEQPGAADLAALDGIQRAFAASQDLFYNTDLVAALERGKLLHAPAWYEEQLHQIREEFERDKRFREYRYLANTEGLYRVQALFQDVQQFIGTPPWRVYKKYQETVERFLPQGSVLRRTIQRARAGLGTLLPHSDASPAAPAVAAISAATAAGEDAMLRWEPLRFATSESPEVSIIIPVFNNWQFTYKCLLSVQRHTGGAYEIIVVDNHSSDETPAMLAAMHGLRVISNDSNEVFVNACNQAALAARGDFLLLLNNDTEVTAGWLDALRAPFSATDTGIVGARLVYPDGSLQEAGNIIWSDATGCNYGHGDDPELPWFNYRRAVDYCSGACLLIRRDLWQSLGGFDVRYAPAYYEDTDLCFSVRARGLKVIYQPRAVVVHYGGASAGKETSSGYKRFQEINRHKFIEKWQDTLASDHVASSAGTFLSRERGAEHQIMVIDHYVPTFDRDSGSQRMVHMLRILRDMGYKVAFWPDDLTYDPRYTGNLQDLGIETFYGELSFEDYMREHGECYDVVLMSRPATAQKYLHTVKKYSHARTVFDTVDLHFVREQRRMELEVRQWKNLEFYLARETDATFVVSPTEKELLAGESFADKVSVVSNIHTLEPCEKGFDERQGLMFIGGFIHPPNEEGIIWFIEYILPLVRDRIPDIHLTIVGSDPTERLLALASDAVTVTGYVEDVAGYFNDSRVFVSPLLHGAGVKGKLGQSFSYGLPVVTTSIGAEGMYLQDGHNALISDSETEFADKVVALYTDKFLWQKLSSNGRQVIRDQFSPETIRAALEQALATPVPAAEATLARSFDPARLAELQPLSLRHPIERTRALFDSGDNNAYASFADFVRAGLEGDGPDIVNHYCAALSGEAPGKVGVDDYRTALARLVACDLVVVEERFVECMVLIEHQLHDEYPAIDLAVANIAQRPDWQGQQQRLDAVYAELGAELTHAFREANHWDIRLYEGAHAIINERLGAIGRLESKLHDYRARCQRIPGPAAWSP